MMTDESVTESNTENEETNENVFPSKSGLKQLWGYNLGILSMNSISHLYFISLIPKHYPFYRTQFFISIAATLFAVLVTIRIGFRIISFQSTVSILHLFWIFYCFSTVPVFMTAISSISQESCNQNISICFEALGLLNDFQLKMFVGVATQIFFVGMLYVEMKRLCLLLQFPFSKFETIRIQLNEMEDTSFDNSTANELPAKNPNDIVIAA